VDAAEVDVAAFCRSVVVAFSRTVMAALVATGFVAIGVYRRADLMQAHTPAKTSTPTMGARTGHRFVTSTEVTIPPSALPLDCYDIS
jgi:hypothetical protein